MHGFLRSITKTVTDSLRWVLLQHTRGGVAWFTWYGCGFVILPVCISVNCKNEHAYARSAIMNT